MRWFQYVSSQLFKLFKKSADGTKLKWNDKKIFSLISLHLRFLFWETGTIFIFFALGLPRDTAPVRNTADVNVLFREVREYGA